VVELGLVPEREPSSKPALQSAAAAGWWFFAGDRTASLDLPSPFSGAVSPEWFRGFSWNFAFP